MCGGFIGKTLGLSGGGGPAPAPTPEAPKATDVKEAVDQQRKVEGEAKGREGTMLTGAQGVSVGMEKLQKKKLLGAVGKLGG
jgi:hypothetical protein